MAFQTLRLPFKAADPFVMQASDGRYYLYCTNENEGEFPVAGFPVRSSDDLINWTKWDGNPLVKSELEWENVFAHKQWVIKENNVVYHYYCAVNRKERFIALATSQPMN